MSLVAARRPQRFRFIPFEVEAMQWRPEDPEAVGAMVGWLSALGVRFCHPSGSGSTVTLQIIGNPAVAESGCWVVHRPERGAFVLSPELFVAGYRELGAASSSPAKAGPAYVHFDGMCWPNPADPGEVEWRMRYGELSESDRMVAASFIAAYRQLVADPQRVRNDKVSALRRALDRLSQALDTAEKGAR